MFLVELVACEPVSQCFSKGVLVAVWGETCACMRLSHALGYTWQPRPQALQVSRTSPPCKHTINMTAPNAPSCFQMHTAPVHRSGAYHSWLRIYTKTSMVACLRFWSMTEEDRRGRRGFTRLRGNSDQGRPAAQLWLWIQAAHQTQEIQIGFKVNMYNDLICHPEEFTF